MGWTRLSFNWAEMQAGGPETWSPAASDEQIAVEIDAGRTVVGLLIGIPEWARDEANLPQGLWLPYDDPANTWAAFVRQAAGRYRGQIEHWVIWNEPDIGQGELAHSWDGSVADFAQLQRVAYLAAREANPEVVIHLAAFTYWADFYAGREQYMARLLDEIGRDPQAAMHNHYFDVATAHLYFQPNQIYDLLGLFIDIMRQRGLEQPIWLVETNAPPKDDPAWPVPNWTLSVTIYEQAAFIPQALASALAAGAERVAVYKLQDTPEDRRANPEPFGLVRRDGSRRPAFDTYRVAVQYLVEALGAERERWDEVGQIRVDQPGQTTTVLFARLPLPQRAQVTATADTALLVNMWGEEQTLTVEDSLYTIDLPPALCTQSIGDYCMIGGTTYYLVQEAKLPPPTPTPTATETPQATETPTTTPPGIEITRPTATVEPPSMPLEQRATSTEPAIESTAALPRVPEPVATTAVTPPESPTGSGIWLIGGGLLMMLLGGTGYVLNRRRGKGVAGD